MYDSISRALGFYIYTIYTERELLVKNKSIYYLFSTKDIIYISKEHFSQLFPSTYYYLYSEKTSFLKAIKTYDTVDVLSKKKILSWLVISTYYLFS